jgi:hypothetical protein
LGKEREAHAVCSDLFRQGGAAAADEGSLYTAGQFAVHAQRHQALSAQATRIHQVLVATLPTGAEANATTEAANAAAAG